MVRALYIGATGMNAQKLNIDVISNNLANSNTSGYKKSKADFQELFYQDTKSPGAVSGEGTRFPAGIQVGLGVMPIAVGKNFSQGDLTSTGNQLDLAIQGDGFFQIPQADGSIAYSRASSFKLDNQGRVVTNEGQALEPAITIPITATSVTVGTDGTVSTLSQGQTDPVAVGQIELAKFINPGGLKALGRNLYQQTSASGTPTTAVPGTNGIGSINQGFTENSNVDVIEEMIGMIMSQRAYEVNSKSVKTAEEMLQMANNLKG